MYTQVWLKFMPVIRLMLKRSISAPQVVKMNRTDFDKAGGGKRAGYYFTVELMNGRIQNRFTSLIAKDLVTALQQNEAAMQILAGRSFILEMNPKCELNIVSVQTLDVTAGTISNESLAHVTDAVVKEELVTI